jgi:predicted deacylase
MEAPPFDTSLSMPIEECGERHLYLATSARYPPREGDNIAVRLNTGVQVATGTTGEIGTGVYSVEETCESASGEVVDLLAVLREKGMVEKVWRHTEQEFQRITELRDDM